MSALLGPDGKEMGAPAKVRAMPTRQEKFNMLLMMFTLMNREERCAIIKQLRPLRRKLDLMYPNGMSEQDIKNDMAKAAQEIVENVGNEPDPGTAEQQAESEALEHELAELSEQEVNATAPNPEVGAEQGISDEPENATGC